MFRPAGYTTTFPVGTASVLNWAAVKQATGMIESRRSWLFGPHNLRQLRNPRVIETGSETMVAIKKDKTTGQALGTGRRKSSVARVRVAPGSGKVTINNKDIKDYFPLVQDQNAIYSTLAVVGKLNAFDIFIRVSGGGPTGQSGACKMGLARALCSYDTEMFQALRDNGFLTRDSRMNERKKPGLHGARRGVQFSKR